jgi:hypothetical protein
MTVKKGKIKRCAVGSDLLGFRIMSLEASPIQLTALGLGKI